MKIALGGLHIESCTFSPLLSREEDFSVLRGAALLQSYPFLAATPEVEAVPILYARALPGGPVEPGFYRRLKAEFLEKLAAQGPFDGLFLHMHGAVSVAGLEDAEGDFLSALRAVVGPHCLLFASYDLHGNLSPAVMDSLDLLSAYRTAPHVDAPETVARAFELLVRCLRDGTRPHKAWLHVPVLLPGEQTGTEWPPADELYRQIPEVIARHGLLDASILIGYVWADEPRSSGAVAAFALQPEPARQAALELGQAFWEARTQFQFGVPAAGVDACIRLAQQPGPLPVLISDSGDNPTAGGAGDTPVLLERLLALGAQNALLAGLADAPAVAACAAAGPGATLDLSLGGKLDPLHARPLAVQARVHSLHDLPWTLGSRTQAEIRNLMAVVDVQGVRVILTARRTTFHRLENFSALGLDPRAYAIIVVKIGYLEPELKQLAARALLALSPGAVNQAITTLPYRRLQRPLFPFDREFAWPAQVH